jgi:hypothetical protein
MKNLKASAVSLILCVLFLSNASAQKLPSKQQGSILAPANIKIDGKTTEWGDKFQAYNNASRVFYTVSNNADNLYLTIRMDGDRAVAKALSGGITFTISPVNKSKDGKNVSITYPAVVNRQNNTHEAIQSSSSRFKSLKKDEAPIDKLNAFVKRTNDQIASFFKEIQITGIKEISDPLISIYNTEGIKTVVAFNDQMEYIYELAIPLKYIETAVKDGQFRYNIKLNAAATIATGAPGPPMFSGANADPELLYQTSPTDFSGEYTLAK